MYGRRSQSYDRVPIDLKLEKALDTHRHIASKVKIGNKVEMDLKQQP